MIIGPPFSDGYTAGLPVLADGVEAQSRYTGLMAEVHIEPQDIEYGEPVCDVVNYQRTLIPSLHTEYLSQNSKPYQIYDKKRSLVTHAITSELNRWIIGDMSFSTFDLLEDDDEVETSMETIAQSVVPYGGQYYPPIERTISFGYNFSKVPNLSALRIDFPNNQIDGYPISFSITVANSTHKRVIYRTNLPEDIYSVYGSYSLYGYSKTSFLIPYFDMSLSYPTQVYITVSSWSIPNRRVRIPEIWLGYIDEWWDNYIYSMSIQKKTSFAPFSLPYSTCSLTFDNSNKLFDPTNKGGAFKSIEDKQEIHIYMTTLPTVQAEKIRGWGELYQISGYADERYVKIATFFQYNKGWKTGNSALTMTWNLVDLLGLLVDRTIDVTKLPTVKEYTFEGEVEKIKFKTIPEWLEAMLSQLGKKFTNMYELSSDLESMELPRVRLDKIKDATCGDILLWICQATGTWIKVSSDSKLCFDYLNYDIPELGNSYELNFDNLTQYPSLQANDDISAIDFTIPMVSSSTGKIMEGTERQYTVNNTDQISSNTESIDNPFILTEEDANWIAEDIFYLYGGNQIDTVGRGNPYSELGDLEYVEITNGAYRLGRIMEQSIEISDHVMKNCKTKLLEVDPLLRYDTSVVLTLKDIDVSYNDNRVYWSVPDNLMLNSDGYGMLKIVLVQAGQSGGHSGLTRWVEYHDDEDTSEWNIGSAGESGLGGYIYVFSYDQAIRGQVIEFHIGQAADPRETLILNPITGGMAYDINTDAREGGHTTVYFNASGGYPDASSEMGSRYENGYIEPISGKQLGRPRRGSPYPNSGDGGSGGSAAYTFLEGDEEVTPDDFDGRTVFAGSMGTRGADGCVIICYTSGPDYSQTET